MHKKFLIQEIDINKRLDITIKKYLSKTSRSKVSNFIKGGHVKVDEEIIKNPSFILKKIVMLEILYVDLKQEEKDLSKYKLKIIFEDENIIAVNKNANLLTHCTPENKSPSLVDLLLKNNIKLSSNNQSEKLGVVHRLDKDTTGIMLFAKTVKAQLKLVESFKNRLIKKKYQTIVWGIPKPPQAILKTRIKSFLNKKKVSFSQGREAITEYNTIKTYKNFFSFLDCYIVTGRTHQIRAHMVSINCPIIGDQLYSRGRNLPENLDENVSQKILNFNRQALHASEINFTHPITNKIIKLKADMPKDMRVLSDELFVKN
tara:strand:+ start:923 stop:1870 length:948 start_codon:yes stop_codon:yes gene_type:complete